MERSRPPRLEFIARLALALLIAPACVMAGARGSGGGGQDAAVGSGGGPGGTSGGTGGARGGQGGTGGTHTGPCVGLECHQTTCTGPGCMATACASGQGTSLSGTVYDPAGKVPLYNVNVYVPNAALTPLSEGASCDRCETPVSGSPVVTALTDAKGNFTLQNPPAGDKIPLVIQVGKWRRELTVPITACMANTLTDKNLTRLPRNQGEGHIPKIALTTGGADALECLLRKIGLDDAEFTPEAGTGRVNLFNGTNGTDHYDPTLNAGAMFTPAPTWWETSANLMKYDLVLHSCEGTERPTNKSPAALQALEDYANAGGRVFASHWHNYWLEFGPAPLPTVATFNHTNSPSDIVSTIDTTFPKGMALADWLDNVGGSTTHGQLAIAGAKHTVDAVNAAVAQRWIYNDMLMSVQYLTANAPIGAPEAKQCGRIVFSDIHVSSGVGDKSSPRQPFPTGCVTTDLSPQEKALEFMLFDLSSCITPDVPPIP